MAAKDLPPIIPEVVPFKMKDEHEISNIIAHDILDLVLEDVYNLAKYNKTHNGAPRHSKKYTIFNLQKSCISNNVRNMYHRKKEEVDRVPSCLEPDRPEADLYDSSQPGKVSMAKEAEQRQKQLELEKR